MADRRTQASVGTDEARALEPEGAAFAGVALASPHVRVVDADVTLPRWMQVKSGRAYEKALQQCDEMLKAFQVCVPWSPLCHKVTSIQSATHRFPAPIGP